jgi:predicted ATPase
LEEDASNLALVLRTVLQDRGNKKILSNLVTDILPFVNDIDIERFADKSLLFKISEKYFKKKEYLPASLISDGTISVAALIVCLYFEPKRFILIEEPERNVHPALIARLVGMMKDVASLKKQILITTHSPEIVKHAGVDSLLLLSRSPEGFSTVTKPVDSARVKTFLKEEIGVDELYEQELLEG